MRSYFHWPDMGFYTHKGRCCPAAKHLLAATTPMGQHVELLSGPVLFSELESCRRSTRHKACDEGMACAFNLKQYSFYSVLICWWAFPPINSFITSARTHAHTHTHTHTHTKEREKYLARSDLKIPELWNSIVPNHSDHFLHASFFCWTTQNYTVS